MRVTQVKAPHWLEAGGSGTLECEWQAEGKRLYSVKWYQGIKEFYRYTPSAHEPMLTFPNTNLTVDIAASSLGKVRITNVSLGASGLFRCEVSGDAPAFPTDYGAVRINVVALPGGGPVIQGVRPRYKVDDWVNLTCVSPKSKPSPNLTFLINGERVELLYLEPQRTNPAEGKLQTTSLRLRFPLRQHLQEGGVAKVRCHAQIHDIYEAADEKLLRTNPRYEMSVFGRFSAAARLQHTTGGTELGCLIILPCG
ncbi:Immunoglobulin-like domain [Trinorchestia longiramus]|nr:Immunoglobulin-like domain [Trinorchestia longiramus]